MKKLLKVSIASLLAVMLATTTVLAQENGEWMQNCKDFPRSVVTKVRLKGNVKSAAINCNDIILESEDGTKITINAHKLSVAKTAFKKMADDGDGWHVYTLPQPAVYRWIFDYPYSDACYENVQFYVDKDATLLERQWCDGDDKLLTKAAFSKVRLRPYTSGFYKPKADIQLSSPSGKTANIRYEGYRYSLNNEASLGSWEETKKWRTFTFNEPMRITGGKIEKTRSIGDVQFYVEKTELDRLLAQEAELAAREAAKQAELAAREAAKQAELAAKQAESDKITGGNRTVKVDIYSVEPPAKVDFTTPEAADYTLVDKNSKKMDSPEFALSMTAHFYAEGVVKAFGNINNKNVGINRDYFFTFSEQGNIIGDWNFPTQEGYVAKHERGVSSVELPGGYKLVLNQRLSLTLNDMLEIKLSFRDFTGGLLYLPDQEEPLKFVELRGSDALWTAATNNAVVVGGYLSGDRLYQVSRDGEVYAAAQIVNGIPYPASAEDKVVSAQFDSDENGRRVLDVKFENGDFVKVYNEYVTSARIRKSSVTAKEVNGKIITTLQLASGDKFIGTFRNYNGDLKNFLYYKTLFTPNNTLFYEGTLIRKDETMIKYISGRTEEEIAAAKKLQAQQNNAIYKQLCDKYGKKYVDSALVGNVIVGMPEELFLERFSCKLDYDSKSVKCFIINGVRSDDYLARLNPNATKRAYVWIRNGRVTSVSNY